MSEAEEEIGTITAFFQRLTGAQWFKNTVRIVILLAGVAVGLETYPHITARYGPSLRAVNDIILWIFVAEILAKLLAEGSRPWNFFKDSWNVFDFVIVAVAFMPFDAEYIAVLRLARLLRFLRLVRALPKLQVLVSALLKSIPSMAYVGLLLFMLFYIYAVAAVFMFGANDPIHFGSLQMAILSLFRVVTGEDWTDVMYIQMYGCDQYAYEPGMCTTPAAFPVLAPFFFVSFMLVGSMVILNLFIGVIMSGMDEAEKESSLVERLRALRRSGDHSLENQLVDVNQRLTKLLEDIELIQIQSRSSPKQAGSATAEPAE